MYCITNKAKEKSIWIIIWWVFVMLKMIKCFRWNNAGILLKIMSKLWLYNIWRLEGQFYWKDVQTYIEWRNTVDLCIGKACNSDGFLITNPSLVTLVSIKWNVKSDMEIAIGNEEIKQSLSRWNFVIKNSKDKFVVVSV